MKTITQRLISIDALRGIVMMLMALDHVRDFFGPTAFQPTDLTNPSLTAPLFLTRWITHFCAPAFVFLAGTSAYLWWMKRRASGKGDRSRLSLFLLTRGAWLIAIEFLVINPTWFLAAYLDPNLGGYFVVAQVIWAIGVSMVVMSGLVWLPLWAIGLFGAVLVGGHNLLDGPLQAWLAFETFMGSPTDAFGKLSTVLHGGAAYFLLGSQPVVVVYPIIPWPGVMALGFLFGAVMRWPSRRRDVACVAIGLGAVALFLVLRSLGLYGEPSPRATYASPWRSALSLINTTKYPPSLQFLLMTLGPAIASLPLLERLASIPLACGLIGPLVTFGRVPFFYYVLHIPLINAASVAMAGVRGWPASWWFRVMSGGRAPDDYRLSLLLVYAVWIAIVVLLYPACRWFARFRSERSWWWLRYF